MGQARMGDTRGMVGYSPAVLSQRLTAALHQLESTDESLRQLTEIDRVRAVSLAQQETVSLAQILKVTSPLSTMAFVLHKGFVHLLYSIEVI